MTITLYYMGESPPCNIVLIVLDLLKIPYEKKLVDLSRGEHLTGDLPKLNPVRCVPTLVDGDLILWESRAICSYLVNEYANNHPIYPTEPRLRAVIDKWLYFDATTLTKKQSTYLLPVLQKCKPDEEAKKEFYETLKILDDVFAKHDYIAGTDTFTLADLSIISTFLFSFANEEDFSAFPSLCKWFERIQAIPAYQETSAKALVTFKNYMKELKKRCSEDPPA